MSSGTGVAGVGGTHFVGDHSRKSTGSIGSYGICKAFATCLASRIP